MRWFALALLGIAVAALVAALASHLVSQQIGLASEPISAGDALAPRLGHEPHRGAPQPKPSTKPSPQPKPTPAPETAPEPETAAPAPETQPTPEPADDGHGGGGGGEGPDD